MRLLAGTSYDFLTARVQKATTSLLAMTAVDTTNLRLTFTAPSNGVVMIRMQCPLLGATTWPQILLGVLDHGNSDAVAARQSPIYNRGYASATFVSSASAEFLVGGLAAGTSYTYDAAYGVEFVVASTNLVYGGLDDTTTNNAYGAFNFTIWDTPGLLAYANYDPASAATGFSLAAASALTAIDTTNLRLTFTAPSSGKVLARIRGMASGTTVTGRSFVVGVLDGATVKARVAPTGATNDNANTLAATTHVPFSGSLLVSGLTPGTSYTWDAAAGSENTMTSLAVKMGGPNNTTQDDAYGGFSFDIWNIDSLPRAIGSVA